MARYHHISKEDIMKKLLTIAFMLGLIGTNAFGMDAKASEAAFNKTFDETPVHPKYATRRFPAIAYMMQDMGEFADTFVKAGKCFKKTPNRSERSICYSNAAKYFAGFAKTRSQDPKDLAQKRDKTYKLLRDLEKEVR